jgi:hypothetical protein
MLILTPLAIFSVVLASTMEASANRDAHVAMWASVQAQDGHVAANDPASDPATDPATDWESKRTCDIKPEERTVTGTFEVGEGEPATEGEAKPEPAIADIKTAEDLFRVLERADRDLRTLQAQVLYKRVFAIAGEDQTRTGSIYFDAPADEVRAHVEGGAAPARRFAVRFTKLTVGDRVEDEDQTYVFEGRWLTEIQGKHKQFIKREIVREGEGLDPLRVGGPLPLPMGQRTDAILAMYDATLTPVEEGLGEDTEKFRVFLADCMQVRLVPKNEHDEHREVRLWYRKTGVSEEQATEGGRRERLLPRLIRAVNQQEDVSLIQLGKMSVNQPLPEGVMDASPPKEPGWDVRTETLAPLAPGDPAQPR